jgi:hypothetical protein
MFDVIMLSTVWGKEGKGEERGGSGMFWEFQEGEGQKEENKSVDYERFLWMERDRRECGGKLKERREDTSHNPRCQTFLHFYDQMCKGHMRRIEL